MAFGQPNRGDRFKKLAVQGAQAKRLLRASTDTKNPDYSDVKYVESLIRLDMFRKMGNLYNKTRLTPFVKNLMNRWLAWAR